MQPLKFAASKSILGVVYGVFLTMGSRTHHHHFSHGSAANPQNGPPNSSMEKIKDKNPLKEKITNQEEQSVASIKS